MDKQDIRQRYKDKFAGVKFDSVNDFADASADFFLAEMESVLSAEKVGVLREIETIAVKTGCDYASAINRYMSNNNISEGSITPPSTPISNKK